MLRIMRGSRLLRLIAPIFLITALLNPITSPSLTTANAAPTRSLTDRPDDLTGPQVHLIYAIASDATDKNWDTNGQMNLWVEQAQSWLQTQVGKKLRFDTFQNDLDISFMRSKMTLAEMRAGSDYEEGKSNAGKETTLDKLLREFLTQSPQRDYKKAPKTYMFYLSDPIKSGACGYANLTSAKGLGFSGPGCWEGPQSDSTSPFGLSWPSQAIIHEVFHTYGVEHTCDTNSDLMRGANCTGETAYAPLYLDQDRKDYYGGEKSGVDISKLPIWLDAVITTPYATLKAKEIYAPKVSNDYIFVVGDKKSKISWEFDRIFFGSEGGYSECTLTNGKSTLTSTGSQSQCEFDIPLTWRGGTTATATTKVWLGPYYGEATSEIRLRNPENYYVACTNAACFVGESESLTTKFCYSTDYKNWNFEIYENGKWREVATSPSRKSTRCTDREYFEPEPVKQLYQNPGTFIYRWTTRDPGNNSFYAEEPRSRTILAADAEYPVGAKVDDLKQSSDLLVKEAAKQAEIEKAARELRERQLEQCERGTNCYIGDTFTAQTLCFSRDLGDVVFESLNGDKWQIQLQAPVKAGQSGCSASTFGTPVYTNIFTEAGTYIFRWREVNGGAFAYISDPYGILITDKAAGVPSAKEIEDANALATTRAKEVAALIAKAEADRIAAERAAKAAAKKSTITCVKGSTVKKVTGAKPTCPKGFKKRG